VESTSRAAAAALFATLEFNSMNDFLSTISHHGYLLVFLALLSEACGLPVPGSLVLVAAGAGAAAHILRPAAAFLAGVFGLTAGDILLFFLGQYTGWRLLAVLCRLSLNPESCILRSAESFYKHGRLTLIFAKFIPGINTMAAPLAGSMKMRFRQFIELDVVGAGLYVLAYGTLGYLFRDLVAKITRGVQSATHVATVILLLAIALIAIYRIFESARYRLSGAVPRVGVEELAHRLASGQREDVLVVDVRSHGYYDPGAARIAGSIRLEPNRLAEELKLLPKDKDIYLYCT